MIMCQSFFLGTPFSPEKRQYVEWRDLSQRPGVNFVEFGEEAVISSLKPLRIMLFLSHRVYSDCKHVLTLDYRQGRPVSNMNCHHVPLLARWTAPWTVILCPYQADFTSSTCSGFYLLVGFTVDFIQIRWWHFPGSPFYCSMDRGRCLATAL